MNFFGLATAGEFDQTGFPGIKSEIPTDTDILTGVKIASPLADQNIAGQNKLAIRTLDSETLGL
jgi:hypothetical protein